MKKVKIEIGNDISVKSPYHPNLPKKARQTGGKWDSDQMVWRYDLRSEKRVRELYLELYGTDGTPCETVDVRITSNEKIMNRREPINIFGREIARAYNRDSGANIADGIVVIEGDFTSGGSAKSWYTQSTERVVFEIYDVPKRLVDGGNDEDVKYFNLEVEIIRTHGIKKDDLIAEKENLLKRLAEIEEKLTG